jgi:hypothetical protein
MNDPGKARVQSGAMPLRSLLLLPLLAACNLEAAEPVWKNELTSPAPGAWPAIPPCVLDFQVSWNGMLDSGRLRIEFAPEEVKKPGLLVVRSAATSTGPAAALFPYQSDFWSELDPASLKPKFFHAVETDRRETVTTTSRHFADRVECLEITRSLKKNKTTRSTKTFGFTPVFDIFSAMLHVRSQKLDVGDQITLVIHPFGNPYLLRVKVLGREIHRGRKTIRLNVGMHKIDRKTLELRPYRKMKRDATLWLSDDAERIPIELRAAAFIGDIRATLTGFRRT